MPFTVLLVCMDIIFVVFLLQYSLTVSHAQSGTTTRFVRPRRSLAIHDRQVRCGRGQIPRTNIDVAE